MPSAIASEAAAWALAAKQDLEPDADFEAAAAAASRALQEGGRLLARLPERGQRDEREREAAAGLVGALDDARERFLRDHAEELYAALTDDYATPLRLDELVYRAAELV